jgi:hypothetical protein
MEAFARLFGSKLLRWLAALLAATVLLSACGGHAAAGDASLNHLVSALSVQDCLSQPVRWPSASQTPGTPIGLARMASERASVGCTPTNAAVVYLSFRSPGRLEAALRAYRRALHRDLCAFGRSVYFYGSLYDPNAAYYMADSCFRLGGDWLPASQA